MFEIFLGLFWMIVALSAFIMNMAAGNNEGDMLWANLLLLGFATVGGIFMATGIKRKVRDKKTDLYGELCYARITDVKFNGTVTNEGHFDAYAKVYIESEDRFTELHDEIGTDSGKYPVGSYVVVRYYEGDINFEYMLPSFDGLPPHIRDKFDNGQIIPDDV